MTRTATILASRISQVVLVASLLLPAAVYASEADAPPPATEDIENMVITGQRPEALRKLMFDFIVEIGDPVSSSRGFARWRHRLCTGVYNLPDKTAAQYLVDKITLAALEVGLKTGAPGCQPNLHIVFSPDARELAGGLVDNSPTLFFPFGNTQDTTQGLTALEQFKTSEAPVRWWQITMVVNEIGLASLILPGINDVEEDFFTGTRQYPVSRGEVSRLKSGVSDAIWASLIIVDASKLDKVTYPQLADYLTMVALAQVDPDASPSGSASILNLFNSDNPPRAMSDMDRIYLRSLYAMNTMMLPHTQHGVFSHRMVRALGEMEEGE